MQIVCSRGMMGFFNHGRASGRSEEHGLDAGYGIGDIEWGVLLWYCGGEWWEGIGFWCGRRELVTERLDRLR